MIVCSVLMGLALLGTPKPTRAHEHEGREDVRPGVVRRTGAHDWAADYLAARVEVSEQKKIELKETFVKETLDSGLDPLLVLSIIALESDFDHRAVSSARCLGLMQLNHATAVEESNAGSLGRVDEFDPTTNIKLGIRYFSRIKRAFGDLKLSLMAYNVGPHAIELAYISKSIEPRFYDYPNRVQAFYKRFKLYEAIDRASE